MVETHTFSHPESFTLEAGGALPGFQLHYSTYGTLSPARDNVVWVCHALTANAEPQDWWAGLFGAGNLYDPARHFVVCANMLGSCYGSTGPLSVNPRTNEPFFHDFPVLTNRDIARSFDLLRQHLGIEQIHTLIGGSLGGQQALEWAIMRPGIVQHLVQVASNARHSPWGIAFNESQRQAIEHDATWAERSPTAGLNGMRTARSIALLSYRHYRTYAATQQEPSDEKIDDFRASSYQRYQGEKLARRFNAFSYWTLSKAMDSHHVGRGRGSIEEVLRGIGARCLFVGIDTDLLFPPAEQQWLAQQIPNARCVLLTSTYGHDGFLVEIDQLTQAIRRFATELTQPLG
jgi:homoserine O-acetyltransferase